MRYLLMYMYIEIIYFQNCAKWMNNGNLLPINSYSIYLKSSEIWKGVNEQSLNKLSIDKVEESCSLHCIPTCIRAPACPPLFVFAVS